MANDDFKDAALVLLGHGSTQNSESAVPTYQHAEELRRRGIFGQVREAFWKQPPNVTDVLQETKAPRVFIAPLFISEGYFADQVIPEHLGFPKAGSTPYPRRQQRESQTLFYSGPIGTHPSIIEVILDRAREVVDAHPFPRRPNPLETGLVIAGHGTLRADRSRQAIERAVALIQRRQCYAEVHPAFLEEEPRIGDFYRFARSRFLVVVPFFMSDGLHAREDIPRLLGVPETAVQERLKLNQPTWRNPTERHGKLVWYASSVGTSSRVVEVILERVREAAVANGVESLL